MIFNRKHCLILFIQVFTFSYIFAQVPNDNCFNASNLGEIVGDHGNGGFENYLCFDPQISYDTCFEASNINAIAEFPYNYNSNCVGYSSTTAYPANDIWYRFTVESDFILYLSNASSSAINNIHISLYTGDSCSNLYLRKCLTLNLTNEKVSETIVKGCNKNFYMQISGESLGAMGKFIIALAPTGSFYSCYPVFQVTNVNQLCFDYKISSKNTTTLGAKNGQASVSIKEGNKPYSFTWSDGNLDSIRNNLAEGKYYVKIVDKNGCVEEDSVEIFSNTITSIFNPENDHVFTLHPNPIVNSAVLEYTGSVGKKNLYFELYNLLGSKVFDMQLTPSKNQLEINLPELNNGIYYYRILDNLTIFKQEKVLIIR